MQNRDQAKNTISSANRLTNARTLTKPDASSQCSVIAAYIAAIGHTGDNALMLDAFIKQGALGWASAALLIGGVVMWFAGGLACLRFLPRTPRNGHEWPHDLTSEVHGRGGSCHT